MIGRRLKHTAGLPGRSWSGDGAFIGLKAKPPMMTTKRLCCRRPRVIKHMTSPRPLISKGDPMLYRFLAVTLIAMSLIAVAGCASSSVEDERGHIGVSTY